MQIEERIFQRKRWKTDAMLHFGFRQENDRYVYETDLLEGDFAAIVIVDREGKVQGTVIDRMNNEEYLQLRMERFDGAYVNTVRNAYETVLKAIAEACCRSVLFASDQANRITEQILARYGVEPDFPWGQDPYDNAGVFRHDNTRKWFGLIMNIPTKTLLHNGDPTPLDVINLKIEPRDAETLQTRAGIYPAYHMNHKMWITVTLNDSLSDEAVMELIDRSFQLTQANPNKKRLRKEPT